MVDLVANRLSTTQFFFSDTVHYIQYYLTTAHRTFSFFILIHLSGYYTLVLIYLGSLLSKVYVWKTLVIILCYNIISTMQADLAESFTFFLKKK